MAGEMTTEGARNLRASQGLGFAAGVYIAYDTMSTLNSSPWTHETFGGDPGKAESAQRYVRLALSRGLALSALTSWIMGSWTPLVGFGISGADLYYVYWRAKTKATEAGH